jgi:hypothetical protein
MKPSIRFAWYDLWMGAYYDRDARVWYVCPLPTLLLVLPCRHVSKIPRWWCHLFHSRLGCWFEYHGGTAVQCEVCGCWVKDIEE